MATLEQLNEIMDRRAASVVSIAPAPPASDLSAVVDALREIAARLEASGEDQDEDGSEGDDAARLAQGAAMVEASRAIARAIAPIAEALRRLEIPAPIVNVAAPAVSVDREPFPEVAEIERDAQGYIARVHFGKRRPARKESPTQAEYLP